MLTTDTIVRPSLLLKASAKVARKEVGNDNTKASEKTDSLGLLRPKEQNSFRLTDVNFAEEGYFKGNKYFKLEKGASHNNGIEGIPAPYALRNDNTITALLLGCFIMAMIAFSVSRNFIEKQIKSFFRTRRRDEGINETAYEVRFQLMLIIQTSLIGSMLYYFFSRNGMNNGLNSDTPVDIMGCFLAVFIAYFLVKAILYAAVNWVFFDRKSNTKWLRSWIFLSSLEGVLLFPLVLLQVYFALSLQAAVGYTIAVMGITKLLALYKSYTIFFKRMGASMQIILYFCALELMPMMALWGVLLITDNYLITNF